MKALLIFCWIIPFVMVLVGVLLKKHPIADMHSGNGYNTPASRKSQEHWDYAQSIAPDIFLHLGRLLAAVMLGYTIVPLLLPVDSMLLAVVGVIVGFCFLITAFLRTERKIKAYFEE